MYQADQAAVPPLRLTLESRGLLAEAACLARVHRWATTLPLPSPALAGWKTALRVHVAQ